MRTVKWNPFLSGVCMLLGGVFLVAGSARADVSSSNPAAIVVFPKIVVDTTTSATKKIDTVIQLTNTAPNPINVRCFWINGNGHCSNDGAVCNPGVFPSTCTGLGFCQEPTGVKETDFSFSLTAKQPIVFTASAGLQFLPLSNIENQNLGSPQSNTGSIQGVPENPMIGELKCIEVNENDQPADSNDLKGEATIEEISVTGPTVDIRGYNGIGIQAVQGANNGDDTLILGGPAPEYNACPNLLIVDNFFDDAPVDNETVRTNLTLVPCTEDLNLQLCITTTVQFLVFNEFEERLSTSVPLTCFLELTLSDIGTRLGPSDDASSIFNVAVQGTISGQILIRGVADNDMTHGHGLLGVAEEFFGSGTGAGFTPRFSDAFNLHQRGVRTQADIISLPAGSAPNQ